MAKLSLPESISSGWNRFVGMFRGVPVLDSSELATPDNYVLPPIEIEPWLIGMEVTHRTLRLGKIQATFLRDETLYCEIDFDSNTQEFRADLLRGFGGFFQDESKSIYLRNRSYMERHGKEYLELKKLKREQQKIEHKEFETSQFSFRRQSYLDNMRIEDKGIRELSESNRHRVTHCWKCKTPLRSEFSDECARCGWFICKCGACGCVY